MRIWFSGPRILGGLIRPGISFSLSEITRLTQRGRAGLPVRREDVIVSREEGPGLNMRVDLAPEALARIAEAPVGAAAAEVCRVSASRADCGMGDSWLCGVWRHL